jgi:hypothetical protein
VFFDATRKPREKWVPLKTGLKDAAKKKFNELERRWIDPDDPWNPWASIAPVRNLTVAEAVDEFLLVNSGL